MSTSSTEARVLNTHRKVANNTVSKAANFAIALGLLFVIIPTLFWAYERYYQLSQSDEWQATVSVGSSDSIRTLRYSEQSKTGNADKSLLGSEDDNQPGESMGIWSPDMVETSTAKVGTSIAFIEIPKIDIKASVSEGESWANLARGPVRVSKTAKVGDKGTVLISGHRTMFGAPFHDLHKMQPGDKIIVYTKKAVFVYDVKDVKKVLPTDWSEIKPSDTQRIVLSTCEPMYSAAKRLLIIGELESAERVKGTAAIPGKPSNASSGDSGDKKNVSSAGKKKASSADSLGNNPSTASKR